MIRGVPFVAIRLLPPIMLMALSVQYSKGLGTENRSILSLVFILSLIVPSLINFALKKHLNRMPIDSFLLSLKSYKAIAWLLSLANTLVGTLVLVFFSQTVEPIPVNLFVASMLYFFVSSLNFILFEAAFKVLSYLQYCVLELFSAALQVLFFISLYFIFNFSLINTVLISFSCAFSSLSLFLLLFLSKLAARNTKKPNPSLAFIDAVRGLFFEIRFSITTLLLEKLDKVLIIFLLPLNVLSKITITLSIIVVLRVLIDDIYRSYLSRIPKLSKATSNLITFSPVFLFVTIPIVNFLIESLFGEEWVLPWQLVGLLYLQETLRMVYLKRIGLLGEDDSRIIFTRTSLRVFIVVCLTFSFVSFIVTIAWGLAAISVFNCICYLTIMMLSSLWLAKFRVYE